MSAMCRIMNENALSDEKLVPPTFIPIILHIYGGKGHVLSYHNSVREAVRVNNWEYKAAVSPDNEIKKFPKDWDAQYVDSGILDYDRARLSIIVKRFQFWKFFTSFIHFSFDLKKMLASDIKKRNNKKIVFLESFNPLQLFSLVCALLFVPRKNIFVWLVYRGGPNWGGPKHRVMARSFAFIFKILNLLISMIIGESNLVLFTDSDMLRKSLPEYYKSPVHLLPIPHTSTQETSSKIDVRDKVVCWWPGAPRVEKGLEIIRNLALMKSVDTHKINLVVAKSCGLIGCADGVEIVEISDRLDRDEYDSRFFKSDIILLPYDRHIYNESTSGIFTESIFAGAIPLVTKKTWMSFELEKYNLSELAIDWDDHNLVRTIANIANDSEIKRKINFMQSEYISYHNIDSLAAEFNSVYNLS